MVIETHALWGEEPTEAYPATYTVYLHEELPDTDHAPRPAVVIVGGGGFTHIAPHEQEPVALEFLNRGFQAFVLDYVTSETGDVSYPHPQADLGRLIGMVRQNAQAWNVNPSAVVALGFSAGGFVCAGLATEWKGGPFAALTSMCPEIIRPDAVILGYPVIDFAYLRDQQTRDPRIDLRVPKTGGKTGRDLLNDFLTMVTGGEATDEHLGRICPANNVDRNTPPTFVWCASDDKTAPVAQVYPFTQRLAEEGVPHEMHVFSEGGHGLSVANVLTRVQNEERQAAVRPWVELAVAFLARQGICAAR